MILKVINKLDFSHSHSKLKHEPIKTLLSSYLGSVSPEVFVQFPYLCLCHRMVPGPSADVDGCNSSVNSLL